MTQEQEYKSLLAESRKDQNALGFILAAGRGKEFYTKYSDYDVAIVVRDKNLTAAKAKYKKYSKIDLSVRSLSEFKKHANWRSDSAWDRYNFTHLKAIIDRGHIQQLIDDKGKVPQNKIKETVTKALDAYLNYCHRSFKNFRDGNRPAARLDAAESIPFILTALFAKESRLRPYNKYLAWELKNHPLRSISSSREFLKNIDVILRTGNTAAQKKMLSFISRVFRPGFVKVFDGWRGYYFG